MLSKTQKKPVVMFWYFDTVRQKNGDTFWWDAPKFYQRFCTGQIISVDLNLFSAYFGFGPFNFQKKKVNSVVQYKPFQNLRKAR